MKKLTVVGMGPGEYESMTLRAVKALNTCDVIVGYTVYVDLAKPYFPNKEFLTTPMKREIERCEMAFAEAEKGRSVVMICSGDAGIYGMSTGLEQYDTYAEIFYNRPVPFQSIDEFLNITYDYVDKHGPFTEESYEKWLDTQLGEVDWDRLEW